MATKQNKKANWAWKNAGKPKNPNHPTVVQRKATKKLLRCKQRIMAATNRQKELDTIMEADSSDKKLFYKLVGKQRKSSTMNTKELKIGDQILNTDKDILEGWRRHFETLATPSHNTGFDEVYKQETEWDVDLIQIQMENLAKLPVADFSFKEISTAIATLNNGKAADLYGMTAEHLKYGGVLLTRVLLNIMNTILKLCKIPKNMKQGIITPVFKKKRK